jgi:subtilisin family serine protease
MKLLILIFVFSCLNLALAEDFSGIEKMIIKNQLNSMNYPTTPYQGNEVLVAVIDTGINYQSKKLKQNLFFGSSDYLNQNRKGHGYDFNHNDLFPEDTQGHGTHVAGIIQSIAPKVKILTMKVFDENNRTDRFLIIKAVRYAMMMGARVINLSLGGLEPEQLNKDFWNQMMGQATFGSRVSIVVAAGNDARNNDVSDVFPANVESENLISVCSVNQNHDLSTFSNYGVKNVDLCALGENVYSLSHVTDTLIPLDGTSMAAPYVTGAIALMLSKNPQLAPQTIKNILSKTATKSLRLIPACEARGVLNIGKAMEAM